METIEPREYHSTAYIDIDGVILPCFNPEPYYDDQNPNETLDKVWLNSIEYYYPEVVEALGSTLANSLVLSSSSRMMDFISNEQYRPIVEALNMQGALFIDEARPGSIHLKYEAVMRHWGDRSGETVAPKLERGGVMTPVMGRRLGAVGVRGFWIDDHITQLEYTNVEQAELGGGMLLVAPRSHRGITLKDVEHIAQTLNAS